MSGWPALDLFTAADQFGTYTFTTKRLEYVCTPSVKEGAPPPPELVLNHFKCYHVNGKFDKRTVGLADQFGTTQTLVKKVDSLCNPVRKTFAGETAPIRDGAAHLECLDIKAAKDPSVGRTVEVTNQFGTERLLVQKPATLCVPTAKTETAADPGPIPGGLDHFKCYDVKGEGLVKRDVILADQFGKEQVDAMHAQLLCNPVEKRHGTAVFTPRFPFAHLVCYQITPRGPFGPRTVRVRNQFQFGLRDLHVVSPRTLCLPSTKEPI